MTNKKKLGRKKKSTLQRYLIVLSVTTAVLFMGILAFIYYGKVNTFLQEKKETLMNMKTDQLSIGLEDQLHDSFQTLTALQANENIITHLNQLSDEQTTATEKYKVAKELERYLYSLQQENSLIGNILLITPDTQYSAVGSYINFDYNGIKLKNSIEDHHHFISNDEASEKNINITNASKPEKILERDFADLKSKTFFGANLEESSRDNEAVILIFLDIHDYMDQSFYADQFAITDRNNNFIFQSDTLDSNMLQQIQAEDSFSDGSILKNKDIELFHTRIPFFGLNLFYAEQLESHHTQQVYIGKTILISFLFAFFMALILSKWVAGKTLNPVYSLLDSIREGRYSEHQLHTDQDRKKGNLRERLFLYFMISLLGPLTIFVLLYFWQTSKVVLADIQESEYHVHENQAYLVGKEIKEKKLNLTRMSVDSDLGIDLLNHDEAGIEQKMLTEKKYSVQEYENIAIYNRENYLIYTNNTNTKQHLPKGFLDDLYHTGEQINYDVQRDEFNNILFVMGKPIYDQRDRTAVAGYMILYIEADYLNSVYEDFNENNTYIIDKDNLIVNATDSKEIGEKFPAGKKGKKNQHAYETDERYYFSTDLQVNDWKFVSSYQTSGIQTEVNRLFLSDSYFIFIVLLLVITFSYWIPKWIMKSLDRINRLFDTFDIQDDPLKMTEAISGIDEIDLLQRNFNYNMQKMNQLINETLEANQQRVKLEYEKREIQMNALQSQVNPHFLYNTLDNLLYIVESNQTDKAVDMVVSLSRFFRFITNREKMIVTIQEEIAYTKTYIAIMAHRFDNFYCTWDIDQDLFQEKTIKLLLQPIIENAIRHGVKETSETVKIEINGKRLDNNTIQISATDDAKGMEETKLKEVRAALASGNKEKSGIYNVNARIKLYFGEKYGLQIQSKHGEGTKVTLTIPI